MEGNWERLKTIIDLMERTFPQARGVQVLFEKRIFAGANATRYGVQLHTDVQSYGFNFIIDEFFGTTITDDFAWRLNMNIESLKEKLKNERIL